MEKDQIKLSIVIPVYNEERFLLESVQRVIDVDLGDNIQKEIVLVNDASKDRTREIMDENFTNNPMIQMYHHEKNKGKGGALKTGFSKVSGDIVIIQDADLEYSPQDYPTLLAPILDGRADVVYGSRFLGGPHRVLMFWHYMGNRFLTFVSNMFNNINLTDMETCYKVFRREVIDSFTIKSMRFGVEPEITAKVAKRKYRIYETPISYSGRTYDEGKKITWKDGFSALYCIIRFRLMD